MTYIYSILYLLQFFSSHFIISYPNNIQINKIEIIAEYLENKYNVLANSWKMRKENKIEVIFYSTTYDFLKYTNSQVGLSGKYAGGKMHLQPITLMEKKKILYPTLSHELAHAFLDEYSKNGLPKWLNESFAVYFSDALPRYEPEKKLRLNHFEDLDTYLSKDDLKTKNTVYFYLGLTMQFFMFTFPKVEIVKFLKSFQPGGEDPYKSSFNTSKKEVEKKWKEYLKGL
jgi:hypothetical protein